MGWLYFFIGLGVGAIIGAAVAMHIKPGTPSNDEAIKQEISDKLDKAIQDIKNTI